MAAAGVDNGALRIANVSGSACELRGFDKIATGGETAPILAEHDPGQPVPEHTLDPGEGVVEDLSWERFGSACTRPQQLAVTAPGTRRATTLPWQFTPICSESETNRITLDHSAAHGGNDSNGIQVPRQERRPVSARSW